jgi:hypothetical protein
VYICSTDGNNNQKYFSKERTIMKKSWVACLTMVFVIAGFGMVQASNVSYQTPGNIQNQVYYLATEQIADQNTVITLPPIEYQMTLVIEPNEDFTLVFDLGSDGEFTADPAINIAGNYNNTQANTDLLSCAKRRGGVGSREIAFACNVSDTNGIVNQAAANLRITASTFNSHALNADGTSGTLELGVWDWTENARVDYSANEVLTFTTKMASGFGNVTDTTGLPQDLGTTIDATLDAPLTGFVVVVGGDNVNIANGNLLFTGNVLANDNTNTVARNVSDPNLAYALNAGDVVDFLVTDDSSFTGLTDLNIVTSGATVRGFTLGTGNANATVSVNGAELGGFGHNVEYYADGTTVLGTSRTLGASATLDPFSGGEDINYPGRTDWWVWDSNGTVLQSPLFNMPGSPWVPNFVLTNTGANDADFTITLQGETGTTITPGTVTSGTIPANGSLVLPVSNVVDSISGGVARGTAIFTVSAAAQNITGLYQLVNPTAGSISNHIMGQVAGGGILR